MQMTATAPLYRLIADPVQRVILTAADVEGFFDASASQVRMLDARISAPLHSESDLDGVELQVLDHRGEVIGRYFISLTTVIDVRPAELLPEVAISFRGYRCPYMATPGRFGGAGTAEHLAPAASGGHCQRKSMRVGCMSSRRCGSLAADPRLGIRRSIRTKSMAAGYPTSTVSIVL